LKPFKVIGQGTARNPEFSRDFGRYGFPVTLDALKKVF